jgi:hypothetical protein
MVHAAELVQSDDGCGLGGAVAFHRSVKRPAAVGSRARALARRSAPGLPELVHLSSPRMTPRTARLARSR